MPFSEAITVFFLLVYKKEFYVIVMFSFYNKIYYINQEASFSNAIPESLNVRLTCVEKSQLHFIIYYFLSNLEASFFKAIAECNM